MEQKFYAVKHNDAEARLTSRSGGAFVAVSDVILAEGGVIYGCGLDEFLEARHMRAVSKEERDRFCGAKYVQSKLGNIYIQVAEDLEQDRKVLFSGTPCQIAGLKSFLEVKKISMKHLILVDLVCYGVPSPLLYKDYLAYIENRYHKKVTGIDFRNKKKYGWRNHVETICFGEKSVDKGIYTKIFCDHKALRPSCYECIYKTLERVGDISLADCWGIEKCAPSFDDNKGVSLMLVNSEKGARIFEQSRRYMNVLQVEAKDCMQPALLMQKFDGNIREDFWKNYHEFGFEGVIRKEILKSNKAILVEKLPMSLKARIHQWLERRKK